MCKNDVCPTVAFFPCVHSTTQHYKTRKRKMTVKGIICLLWTSLYFTTALRQSQTNTTDTFPAEEFQLEVMEHVDHLYVESIEDLIETTKVVHDTSPTFAEVLTYSNNASTLLDITKNEAGMEGPSFPQAPDVNGDVGPDEYVQMVNDDGAARIRIVSKITPGTVAKEVRLDAIFNAVKPPVGTFPCATGGGHGSVLYDHIANRWLFTESSRSGSALCVYYSTGSSPLGPFQIYQFVFPVLTYPKIAMWPNAYLIGGNETSTGSPNVAFYAIDRTAMLAGLTVASVRNAASVPLLAGYDFQLAVPVTLQGSTLPVARAPGVFLRHEDGEAHGGSLDKLTVMSIVLDFAHTTGTVSIQKLRITPYDSHLGGLSSNSAFVPQPSTNVKLNPQKELIMNRPQYRVFASHESIVSTWTVKGTGNRAAIRWMEIRRTPGGSGFWKIYQQGTYSPPANTAHRFIPSIAMNENGDISIGYSLSSSTVYPSIYAVGRLESDPVGEMTTGEMVLQLGSGSQKNTSDFGAYGSLSIDPVDDRTFWFTGAFTRSADTYSTRIVAFRLSRSPTRAPSTVLPTEAPVSKSPISTKTPVTFVPSSAPTICPRSTRCPKGRKGVDIWHEIFLLFCWNFRCVDEMEASRLIGTKGKSYGCGTCGTRNPHKEKV